eukprot:264161-Chlamydomonas_euryale.AAC.1
MHAGVLTKPVLRQQRGRAHVLPTPGRPEQCERKRRKPHTRRVLHDGLGPRAHVKVGVGRRVHARLVRRQAQRTALGAVDKHGAGDRPRDDAALTQRQQPERRQVTKEVHVTALQVDEHKVAAADLGGGATEGARGNAAAAGGA